MKTKLIPVLLAAILLSNVLCFSASGEDTETGYRISGMVSRLQTITPAQVEAALARFPDMKKHWSRQYAGKLALLEIVNGVPGTGFNPDGAVKVDEFLKLTVCAMGYRPGVGVKYWAEPYIQLARENGLISEGEFTDYKRAITREEMAKIIVLATMLKEPAPDQGLDELCRLNIRDYAKIGDMYKQSVITAYRLGLINGTPEAMFNPKKTLTRGEASAVILKNLDAKARTPFKPENGFAIQLTNAYSGQSYVVCRPDKREEIKTAYVVKNSLLKSKGWAYISYSPDSDIIGNAHYDSEERFKLNSYDIHMGFTINLYNGSSSAYFFTIYQPQKVKTLHIGVVSEIFKCLFEADASKVIAQFDKYIELGVTNAAPKEEIFTFNKRKFHIYKSDKGETFSIRIYAKQ